MRNLVGTFTLGKSKGLPFFLHSPTPCVEKRAIWHCNFGRIVHETHSAMGVDNTHAYNTFGRLSSVASNGSTRTFACNSLGRLEYAGNTIFVGSGARVWVLQVGKGQVVGSSYKKSKKNFKQFSKGYCIFSLIMLFYIH